MKTYIIVVEDFSKKEELLSFGEIVHEDDFMNLVFLQTSPEQADTLTSFPNVVSIQEERVGNHHTQYHSH